MRYHSLIGQNAPTASTTGRRPIHHPQRFTPTLTRGVSLRSTATKSSDSSSDGFEKAFSDLMFRVKTEPVDDLSTTALFREVERRRLHSLSAVHVLLYECSHGQVNTRWAGCGGRETRKSTGMGIMGPIEVFSLFPYS